MDEITGLMKWILLGAQFKFPDYLKQVSSAYSEASSSSPDEILTLSYTLFIEVKMSL